MRHHHIFVWGFGGSVGKAFGKLGSRRVKRWLFVGVHVWVPVGSSSSWAGGRLVFDQLVTLCLFSRSRACCGIGVLVLVGCPLALLTFGFSGSGSGGAAFLYAKI
jgi:hypothetical protein